MLKRFFIILCLITLFFQISMDFLPYSTYASTSLGFWGQYYSGTNSQPFLDENLILEKTDLSIDYNWAGTSPDISIPADVFTVRWKGDLVSDETGIHTFRTNTDDGIRLYIDNVAIINNWTNHAEAIDTATINLSAGVSYEIRLEYFENSGDAVVELDWQRPSDTSYITLNEEYVTNDFSILEAPTDIDIFDNVDSGTASGAIIGNFTTTDPNIGDEHIYSLVSGIGDNDNGEFTISGSTLIINNNVDYNTKSAYTIRVETNDGIFTYQKNIAISVINTLDITNGFCGAYYNGTSGNPFDSGDIILKRTDLSINNYWGTGSPDSLIPNNYFTVQWNGVIESDETGIHNFRTYTDDGVILYINDIKIVNNWTDHGSTYDIGTFSMTAGEKYDIKMEFYEATGGALAKLNWQKPSESSYSVITDSDVVYYGECIAEDYNEPIITGSNINEDDIIPKHNFDINYTYIDNNGGVGIDENSIDISFFKRDNNNWGNESTSIYINSGSLIKSSSYCNIETKNITYGKYKTVFNISDLNGNIISKETIFYVDEPSMTISDSVIDLGDISHNYNSFSDTKTITVKTVGAPFRVSMNITNNPDIITDEIPDWDGKNGLGYQEYPFTNNINTISTNQIIGNQIENININGEKNIYTYEIQIGALVDYQQTGGDYLGKLDFKIEMDY